jgi:hypothetical protein
MYETRCLAFGLRAGRIVQGLLVEFRKFVRHDALGITHLSRRATREQNYEKLVYRIASCAGFPTIR